MAPAHLEDEGLSANPSPRGIGELSRLRWVAICLPAAFLAAVAFAAQLLLPPLMPPFATAVAVVALELVAVCFFAGFMFARIERAEADVVRQSREQLRLSTAHTALLQQTQRRADQSAALYALSRQIAASPNTSQVLELVSQKAIELLGGHSARVCLLDPDKQVLRPGVGAGACSLPCGATRAEDFAVGAARAVLDAPGAVDISSRRGFCPLMEPRATRTHLAAPVRGESELLGAICVGSSVEGMWVGDDGSRPLLENLATLTAIALQKERLQQRVAALAIHEERDRIAMDLHDGIIQTIYGVGLNLEKAVEQVATDPPAAGARVERAIGDLNGIIQDVRGYIFELERSAVDASDVRLGLARLAQEFQERTPLTVDVRVAPDVQPAVPSSAVPHVLQVVREALANAVRHSGGTRADVRLGLADDSQVELVVRDNGRGFEAASPPHPRLARAGRGLANMAERARLLGGNVHVGRAPAGGTEVKMLLPAACGPVVASEGSEP